MRSVIQLGRRLAPVLGVLAILASIPVNAAALGPVSYFGGPVVNQPNVHLIFWGSKWGAYPEVRSTIESEFGAISGSAWQAIMTQYYDSEGPISNQITVSSWLDGSIAAPSGINQSQIESEIEYSTTQTGWPLGGMNNVYMIFPAPGSHYAEGYVRGCGEHQFSNRIGSPFTQVIWPPDEGWSASNCSSPNAPVTNLADMTGTAAHEYAEAVTDPVTEKAAGHKTGWIESGNTNEIADFCAAGQLGNGIWVEKLWSNAQNECTMAYNLPQAPVVSAPDDNTTGPRAVAGNSGTVDVFFRNEGGQLGHDWYTPSSGWATEVRPGSIATTAIPRVIRHGNGIIDVFYRTPSNELGHDWYIPANGWAHEVRPD